MINNPSTEITELSHSHNLFIVRVKRKRTLNPSESLCIIEDNVPDQRRLLSCNRLTKSFEKLNYNQNNKSSDHNKNQNYVILQRVNTVDASSDERNSKLSIDDLKAKNADLPQQSQQGDGVLSVMFIPNKKRVLHSSSSERLLLVDMTQLDPINNICNSMQEKSTQLCHKKTPILDPATRQLNGAILMANKSGDFTGVVLAISHGANLNHRTSDDSGGLTAVMVASKHCNLRMIKRLLGHCCDVFIKNSEGQTAVDIAQGLQVTPEMATTKFEIQQWLQRAALKQHNSAINSAGSKDTTKYTYSNHSEQNKTRKCEYSAAANDTADMDDDNDFVYDIFHPVGGSSSSMSMGGGSTDTDQLAATTADSSVNLDSKKRTMNDLMSTFIGPIVPVEVIKKNLTLISRI